MDIHGAGSDSVVIDSASGPLSWSDAGGWLWGSSTLGNGSLNVDQSTTLEYRSWVSEPSVRQGSCSIGGNVDDVEASCTIMNGSEKFLSLIHI